MIYLGADHGGFELKEKIKKWLTEWGYQWEDLGNTVYDKDDDYPKYAFAVAQRVAGESDAKGILACRSAAGMVIAANRIKGIRAVTAFDPEYAKITRLHNDANILAIAGDRVKEDEAKNIIKIWLDTEFSGEDRHLRRLKQMETDKF